MTREDTDSLVLRIPGPDGAVALIAGDGRTSTLGEMRETVRRSACALADAAPGRLRVASILKDSPATSVALLSLCEYATAAPLNPALAPGETAQIVRELGADAILADPGAPVAADLARELGIGLIHLHEEAASHAADYRLEVARPPAASRPDRPDIALVLPTSGSTGRPKLVPLRRSSLLESAGNIARVLQLGPQDEAVHMLPVFHIGAVADLLLAPLLSGGRVRFAHPPGAENLKAAIRAGATWFQAVPTMLHNLLANATDEELSELGKGLRFIRSVSADLAPAVQEAAEARLGGVPIIQMYGMTETAGQIASNPLPPAARKPGSVGRPAGPGVAILDRYGNPVPEGNEGEVCVRGPTVTEGYENTESATHFHGSWLRTGDLGRFDADGYLFLTGRDKDMINRGGEKIAPFEIEQQLHRHPAISEAAAFAIPHPTLGEEVGVAVVAQPGAEVDEAAVRAHLMQHVARFKLPRRVWVLDALPRLGSGKVDRNSLKGLADGGRSQPGDSGPRTELGRTVARLWAEALGARSPRLDDDFFDAGGDSLAAASFLVRLEHLLGVSIPANMLYEAPRFGQFEQALQGLLPEAGSVALDPVIFGAVKAATASWPGGRRDAHALLVARNAAADKAPFFFSMQGRDQFEDLVAAFGGTRPVYLMRSLSKLRGAARRRLQVAASTRQLARHYAHEIVVAQPQGPILLGGFCQGAVVARAIASELVAMGREIGLMVVIDRHFGEPCPFPAALVWSTTTEHSPAAVFLEPERAHALCYPAGASCMRAGVTHDEVMHGDSARRIAAFIDPLLDAAAAREGPAPTAPPEAPARLAERRAAHVARIVASAPRIAGANEPLAVRVRVVNASPVPWPVTAEGGFFLGARWLKAKLPPDIRKLRVVLAGHAELPRALAPGASAEFELQIPFPPVRAPHVLLLDMVDDGLCWFHESGSRPFRRIVLPRFWAFDADQS